MRRWHGALWRAWDALRPHNRQLIEQRYEDNQDARVAARARGLTDRQRRAAVRDARAAARSWMLGSLDARWTPGGRSLFGQVPPRVRVKLHQTTFLFDHVVGTTEHSSVQNKLRTRLTNGQSIVLVAASPGRPGQITLPRARLWSPLHVRRHKLHAPHYARAALFCKRR
jgi:hypothetical protein